MAIDLINDEPRTLDELKSRGMSRLAAKGIGYAERLANLERMAYAAAGAYTPSATAQAQIDAIGAALIAEELDYEQEKVDNALLAETVAYEDAQVRLAAAPLTVADYPPVDDGHGGTIENPVITADTAERAAAQAIVDGTRATAVTLANDRAAARA